MIQRHLLMHVYNPSQFFRGRTPLVSSSPYIPYAQFSAGMPGQRKKSSYKYYVSFYLLKNINHILLFFYSAGPDGEQGLPV